tara:strand:- start:449 stop:1327 length:879 start_codon:yes stop_codon:yes gene_type:complete
MKKFQILIPVYNDWESVFKLLDEIDSQISIFEHEFSVLIVDDASTEKMTKTNINYKKLKSVNILKMKKNQGHARCNATGVKYLSNNKKTEFDYLIVMDGDGEDRPEEIKLLVNKALNTQVSVAAKRIKRSEGPLFQTLYRFHKIITLIFAGKNMNFGNYTCLTKQDVIMLSSKKSLWSSFPGSVKKYIKNIDYIESTRGIRYEGPSKMSLIKLIVLSFSIIATFKYQVLLRSLIICSILFLFLKTYYLMGLIFGIFLISFTVAIFIISNRENREALENSTQEIEKNLSVYTS